MNIFYIFVSSTRDLEFDSAISISLLPVSRVVLINQTNKSMYTKTIDGIYSKKFSKELPKRSFLKRIDRNKVIGLSIAFLIGVGIAGNIMGYAINWSN